MKPYTGLLTLIHVIYIIFVQWLGPYILYYYMKDKPCKFLKWIFIWIVIISLQQFHWYIPQSKSECFLSYLEKKSEDPNYIKGSDPKKTYAWVLLQEIWPCKLEIDTIRNIHYKITKLSYLAALFFITIHNKCIPNYHITKQILFVILSVFVTTNIHSYKKNE